MAAVRSTLVPRPRSHRAHAWQPRDRPGAPTSTHQHAPDPTRQCIRAGARCRHAPCPPHRHCDGHLQRAPHESGSTPMRPAFSARAYNNTEERTFSG